MIHKIRFKVTPRLGAIVEHARTHEPMEYFGRKLSGRFLFICRDHGVYLISSAEEGQLEKDLTNKGGAVGFVQYAVGFDPRVDKDWFAESAKFANGDDFAVPIPVEFFLGMFLPNYPKWLTVETDTKDGTFRVVMTG